MFANRARRTVADILESKGKGQLTMLRLTSLAEAEAAQKAGIELASVPEDLVRDKEFRDAAPDVFAIVGIDFWDVGTADDYIRWAYPVYGAGADAIYCCASHEIVRRMADDGVPVCGHVGLIPQRMTWTGGFKAVGKSLDSAKAVFAQTMALETAGAFAAEIEVVPDDIARLTSENTELFMISMGSGAGCDAQYLYAEDVLGENRGHVPRHSKVYRNFAQEYDRLNAERAAAFAEFRADVLSSEFPATSQVVKADPSVTEAFSEFLKAESDAEST